MIPSICLFYDREERAAGVALMWLNGIIGIQIGKSDKQEQ